MNGIKGNKRAITFRNQEHEMFYRSCLQKCRQQDAYHFSAGLLPWNQWGHKEKYRTDF